MEKTSADSFVVILFSNTQEKLYPENVPSEFRNQLAHPLKLGSEWEVALMDVHFMHNFDNFVKDVKMAVLVPTPRQEHSTNSLRLYDTNGEKIEFKLLTQHITNIRPHVYKESKKDIEDYITPDMLRDRGVRFVEKALLIVKEGTRYRRFDVLPHFPEIAPVQRFERTVGSNETYTRYVLVNIEAGYNHTSLLARNEMIDSITKDIKFPIETRRTILKRIIKRKHGATTQFYSYVLPISEDVVCKPRLLEDKEHRNDHHYDDQEPPPEESCDDNKLEHMPSMTDVSTNAQELGEYNEVYDKSLHIKYINQSAVSTLPSSSTTKDPTPWFVNNVKQFQNKFNEEQIEVFVSGHLYTLNRGYFQSMTDFCKHFCNEINKISCKDGECLNFNYSELNGTLEFITTERFSPIQIISDSNYLSSVLGIKPVMEVCTKGRDSEVSYVYQFPCKSVLPPRLDFVHSFVVYSDVCDFVLTGGTETQHLARFPVRGEPGQHVAYVANPPSYLPVRFNEVSSIYINLVDYYGNKLPFSPRHRNVVSVKLHFRKRV